MIRNLCLLLVGCAILLIANFCSSSADKIPVEKIETTNSYGEQEIYYRRIDNFAKEGLYTRKSPQGLRIEEANYINDTLHGMRILYYEKGDTQSVEYHKMGIFDGPFRLYYPSGQLAQEGLYINSEMTGSWKTYYESGQLREIVQFENNEENGPFVEYYENGNKEAEGAYRNGDAEHGELKLYDETGKLTRIMDCDKGVCKTRWSAEGDG